MLGGLKQLPGDGSCRLDSRAVWDASQGDAVTAGLLLSPVLRAPPTLPLTTCCKLALPLGSHLEKTTLFW